MVWCGEIFRPLGCRVSSFSPQDTVYPTSMCDIGVNMLLLFFDNSCKLCSCFYCSFRCYEVWWDGVWWRIWARGSHLQQSRTYWALSGNGQFTFFWGSTIFIKKNTFCWPVSYWSLFLNLIKDMYCHNICNLLMIINHEKKKITSTVIKNMKKDVKIIWKKIILNYAEYQ